MAILRRHGGAITSTARTASSRTPPSACRPTAERRAPVAPSARAIGIRRLRARPLAPAGEDGVAFEGRGKFPDAWFKISEVKLCDPMPHDRLCVRNIAGPL